jgi:imidazole glycerol phosphate synthase glutamine amidotransferase subunit
VNSNQFQARHRQQKSLRSHRLVSEMSSLPIIVVRTGTSNAASIFACLRRAGFSPEWATDPKQVEAAAFVMVPGVGTFGDALTGIRSSGMEEVLKERVRNLRPTFFICVGIQLLARCSEESPGVAGLCLLDTEVVRFPSSVLVPQHGWNEVLPCSVGAQVMNCRGSAYFSNSFCMRAPPSGWWYTSTTHGYTFCSSIERGPVCATQFHPELSSAFGHDIIKRWQTVSLAFSASASVPSTLLPATSNLKIRVVPCLDVKNGRVVKGIKFQGLSDSGDPAEAAGRYCAQGADEIVILDVSATLEERANSVETVRKVRERINVALTVGGGVRSAEDAARLLDNGADKVAVNSAAVSNPQILNDISSRFGSQCCVLAIDAKARSNGQGWIVAVKSGSEDTALDVVEWAVHGVQRGAGEVLLTSFDKDGTRSGYDLELLQAVARAVNVPVVASGGAFTAEQMAEGAAAGAQALLAASVFHYNIATVDNMKRSLHSLGVPVRNGDIRDSNARNTAPIVPVVAGSSVSEAIAALSAQVLPAVILKSTHLSARDIAEVRRASSVSSIHVWPQDHANLDADAVFLMLDAGIETVFLPNTLAATLVERGVPASRLTVLLSSTGSLWCISPDKEALPLLDALQHIASGVTNAAFCISAGADIPEKTLAASAATACNARGLTGVIVGMGSQIDNAKFVDTCGMSLAVQDASVDTLAESLWLCLRSDRNDCLVTTVVVDEHGETLGLAYSSAASLKHCMNTLQGTYWSRNRGLWVKGLTSGHVQHLQQVLVDCDRDCLVFRVQQTDAFCHQGHYTCFGHEGSGIKRLQRTLTERQASAPPGSYTARLYNDRALLASKMKEEIQVWLLRACSFCLFLFLSCLPLGFIS